MDALTTIWFTPRETVRNSDKEPVWLKIAIVWAWGAAYALERAMSEGHLSGASFEARLSFPLIIGLFGGLSYFWTMPIAIVLTGSWFKGRAASKEIRRALIVGAIPRAMSVLFLVLMAMVLRHDFFDETEISEDRPISDLVVLLATGLLIVVLTIWSIIATSKALAEVQGFKSAWKAWLHYVVAFLCFVIVLMIPLTLWMVASRS